MSLEDAIHLRWDSYKPLADVAPLVTDQLKSKPEPPYVVLERVGESAPIGTSEGTLLETTQFRFTVWAPSKGLLETIAQAIKGRYNRAGFDWDAGKVLNMRFVNRAETLDGTAYKGTLDYEVLSTDRTGVLA